MRSIFMAFDSCSIIKKRNAISTNGISFIDDNDFIVIFLCKRACENASVNSSTNNKIFHMAAPLNKSTF